ncbi:MAG: hypothetical protein VYD19_09660 [Myxococcota bacterium]|nr:hypothetical protein [Myxococcota bacterium]
MSSGATARWAITLAWEKLSLALLALTFSCGDGVIRRVDELPPPPPQRAFLQLDIEPRDALLLIDDRPFAVPLRLRRGVTTAPLGYHRIEIQRSGYLTWYGEITLTAARPHRLHVRLLKIPQLFEE